MKSLEIEIYTCDEKSIAKVITGWISSLKSSRELFNQMKQIGINCCKLKSFSINSSNMNSDECYEYVMQTINNNFTQIKRLRISGNLYGKAKEEDDNHNMINETLRSHLLDKCKRLTHFTFTVKWYLNDSFFDNIGQHLPKLQYLSFENYDTSDEVLNELSKLTHLRAIKVGTDDRGFDNEQEYLGKHCPKFVDAYYKYFCTD
ncbi:unnamed protein product [Oppiella nova]|uniref:Uncharacterized protein n=1 Tax=Oppiella nova TaxID=334625 RepID=A0A7R9LF93_9ACAR|nr:unnamed protein product [Oppiella nova]CAG2162583.1 unnamed protein product [Oppiella nova]